MKPHRLLSLSLGCMLSVVLVHAAENDRPAPPQAGSEWTRFRGPNGTGIGDAASLPVSWTEADYLWQASLPGIGHSSPVIFGNRLFITSGVEATAERVVLCYNAATGEKLWERRFPSSTFRSHRRNSYASHTPALDAQHVYITWTTPDEYTLLALTHDGAEAWRRNLGPFVSRHGSGASPIVFEDLVIVADDQEGESALLAFHGRDGSPAWRTPREAALAAYSTPCLWESPDKTLELIVNSESHGISALDPRSGKLLWEIKVFDKHVVGSPIAAGGLLFGSCGSGGGGNSLVAIRPGPDPQIAYKISEQAPYVPTLVSHGDLVFVWSDKGIVTCLDAPTGKVVWRERVGGNYYGSPVRVGDRLYCIAEDGIVVVLAASKNFEVLARNDLGESSHSTPAIAGGRMYLRSYSKLFCLAGKQK
jgi:outer membrane protein assembly factor BamB